MKRKGFSSNSYVTRNLRRARRVLVAAGFLALGVGLWPSAAQAGISCKVKDFRACGVYECCLISCVYCFDSLGNEVGDPVCSDVFCYNLND